MSCITLMMKLFFHHKESRNSSIYNINSAAVLSYTIKSFANIVDIFYFVVPDENHRYPTILQLRLILIEITVRFN